MPSIKVKAIVTRAVPYKESDMIITLVSVEDGVITASARGCLKPKAKLRFAAEPMNFGEYVLTGTGDRFIVTECSQIDAFLPLTAELDKYYAAGLILELLQKLSVTPLPRLFLSAVSALSDMAYGGKPAAHAVTDYLLDVLKLNGSELDFSKCAICKCVLDGACAFASSDGIVCPHCADYTGITVDALSRAYIADENRDIPDRLKNKTNMLLGELVYSMLGVKISSHYFTEQI